MKALRTLVAKSLSHSSTVVSSIVPRVLTPTLFTSTSIRPNCSTVRSIRARQSTSFETSARTTIARPPSSTMLRATAWHLASSRPEMTTARAFCGKEPRNPLAHPRAGTCNHRTRSCKRAIGTIPRDAAPSLRAGNALIHAARPFRSRRLQSISNRRSLHGAGLKRSHRSRSVLSL